MKENEESKFEILFLNFIRFIKKKFEIEWMKFIDYSKQDMC